MTQKWPKMTQKSPKMAENKSKQYMQDSVRHAVQSLSSPARCDLLVQNLAYMDICQDIYIGKMTSLRDIWKKPHIQAIFRPACGRR